MQKLKRDSERVFLGGDTIQVFLVPERESDSLACENDTTCLLVPGSEQAGERGEEPPPVYRESSGDADVPGAGAPQPQRAAAPETGEGLGALCETESGTTIVFDCCFCEILV